MGLRRDGRETAVQFLFSKDIKNDSHSEDLDNFFSTPHIAGTSNQTISKLGHSAIKFLIDECKN